MNMKNTVVILLVSIVIILSISNIYQYKRNLDTKISYGESISEIGTYALFGVPNKVLNSITKDTLDEVNLASTIEHVNTVRILSVRRKSFSKLTDFLDKTEKDLKKLNSFVQNHQNQEEINLLIQQIEANQKKSLETYENIKIFFDEYLEKKKTYMEGLVWYNNSEGHSKELVKIMEEGLSLD